MRHFTFWVAIGCVIANQLLVCGRGDRALNIHASSMQQVDVSAHVDFVEQGFSVLVGPRIIHVYSNSVHFNHEELIRI